MASFVASASVEEYRRQCPWCKHVRVMNMALPRAPPPPPSPKKPKGKKHAYGGPAALVASAHSLPAIGSPSAHGGAPPPDASASVSSPQQQQAGVGATGDRDVYQCGGCLYFSVKCRGCDRAHARRGTPPFMRAPGATPLPHSNHDPLPHRDDPEGVWEDDVCCVCDGSSVPGLAALLTPRMCSACVTIGTHRYRRERPGLGIGLGVSVGGVKGSALGLGSRLLDGVDGASTMVPPWQSGEGRWLGAGVSASGINVDGVGDYYSCDGCGSHTLKCAGCDVGMALVPEHPKDYTALYGFPGDHGSAQDAGSYSRWSGAPPLCILCNGWFAADEEAHKLTTLLSSSGVKLRVFMPQADPGRRDLARMLVCLFGDSFTVVPEELQLDNSTHSESILPPVDSHGSHHHAPPSISLFLPSALPKGVYVDHPVRGSDVRLLVSQFHTLIAQEKGEDLVQLVRALGGKAIAVKIEKRRDSLDGPSPALIAASAHTSSDDSNDDSNDDSDDDDDEEEEGVQSGTKSPHWGGASVASRGTKKSGGVSLPRSPSKASMKSTMSSGGLSSVVSRMKEASVIASGATPPPTKPPPFDPFAEVRAAKAAKDKADAEAVALRVERWKAWMTANAREAPGSSTTGTMASGTGTGESNTAAGASARLKAKRTAQLTVLRQFPPKPTGTPPSVPDGLTWLALEPSWQAMVEGRMNAPTPITDADAVVSSEDSYGIDAYLDGLLLHPMLAGLCLQSGVHGVGAVEKSFALEPTLPRLRVPAPGVDPAPALPSVMLDQSQVASLREVAAQRAAARPRPPAFVEPFAPARVTHTVSLWPYTHPPVRNKDRPLPQAVLDRMRERKWRETTMDADPPMWSQLRHPHL